MTHPKTVRKAAKSAARDCGDPHITDIVWVQITPKYSVGLFWEEGGLELVWHPQEPTASRMAQIKKDVLKRKESGDA